MRIGMELRDDYCPFCKSRLFMGDINVNPLGCSNKYCDFNDKEILDAYYWMSFLRKLKYKIIPEMKKNNEPLPELQDWVDLI